MVELVVTRGLPGCGKSTWAKAWVDKDVTHRARVERDQLRNMMHNGVWKGRATEDQIVIAQTAIVGGLLLEEISVVVSDTNLPEHVFDMWKGHAERMGVKFTVKDFRQVPLETVLKQNAQRTGKEFIPKHVILDMNAKYIKRDKPKKPVDIQAVRAKMTERERFEYNNPDFEG